MSVVCFNLQSTFVILVGGLSHGSLGLVLLLLGPLGVGSDDAVGAEMLVVVAGLELGLVPQEVAGVGEDVVSVLGHHGLDVNVGMLILAFCHSVLDELDHDGPDLIVDLGVVH